MGNTSSCQAIRVGAARRPMLCSRLNCRQGAVALSNGGDIRALDWFTNDLGEVIAQEYYSNKSNLYRIRLPDGPAWTTILKEKAGRPPYTLVGVMPDYSGLIVYDWRGAENFTNIRTLGFDGQWSLPLFQRDDASVEWTLKDIQRRVFGVRYSGIYPSYEFFDPELTAAVSSVQAVFEEAAVSLSSWSADFRKLLLYVEGSQYAGDFYLFDRDTNTAARMTSAPP